MFLVSKVRGKVFCSWFIAGLQPLPLFFESFSGSASFSGHTIKPFSLLVGVKGEPWKEIGDWSGVGGLWGGFGLKGAVLASRKSSVRSIVGLREDVHSSICGRRYWRKAVERQRPSNMMLAGGCPAKKSAMAAPDRSERVPMLALAKPKVGLPPSRVQARRRWRRRSVLVRCRLVVEVDDGNTVLSSVVGGALGTR